MNGLSESSAKQVHAIIETLLRAQHGVMGVVVASVDGFGIACASDKAIDESRLAALASSISSLGTVVSEETQLGRSKSVIVECSEGFAAVVEIAHPTSPMILITVASAHAVLGQVLYRSREAGRLISAIG